MGNMRAFTSLLLSFQNVYIVLLLFLFLLYITLAEFRRVKKLIGHGPTTYPIVGCLISFYKNRFRLLDWYTELVAQSPTNTIVVHRLGARRTIVTANPENVEYILKTNFNNFPKGNPFTEILGDFLGHGIFNVDGESWLTQRKLASHEFSARSLREFVMRTLEEQVCGRLLPMMDQALSMGHHRHNVVVDLQELLGRLSFNVICKFALGIDYDDDDGYCLDPNCFLISPLARAFDVAAEISARRGAAPLFLVWRVKRWLRVGSEKKLKEAVEEVQTRVTEMIHEKKHKMNVIGEKHGCDNNGDGDLLSRLISLGGENFQHSLLIYKKKTSFDLIIFLCFQEIKYNFDFRHMT